MIRPAFLQVNSPFNYATSFCSAKGEWGLLDIWRQNMGIRKYRKKNVNDYVKNYPLSLVLAETELDSQSYTLQNTSVSMVLMDCKLHGVSWI